MLVVFIAISVIMFMASRVLFVQLERQTAAELVHEGDKLRDFAAGIDPLTANGYSGVDTMLADFLAGNLPEENETFFTIVDGKADRRSAHTPLFRLDSDVDTVNRLGAVSRPETGSIDTSAGVVKYAAFPVALQGDPRAGVLVVAEFIEPQRAQLWSILGALLFIGVIASVAAGIASWFVAGRILAPIRLVRETAERIGESGFDERIEVRGNDDVASLARTFNRMLERVGSAFSTQRRFLDDASHELRTPITVIRGHIELSGRTPEEQDATRALALDELDRMSRIVDDLMLMAKAERPDFVRPQPVELTELTIDTLAKWKSVAPRDWSLDGVAEATVLADEQRLAQALMQLVTNAVAHTNAGDPIALGSAVTTDRVRLWVRDGGTGLLAEDRERIFERFVQIEADVPAGEERTRSGAGLGLAIVARIAAAHGGVVQLESVPGDGATFTLDFPRIDVTVRAEATPSGE